MKQLLYLGENDNVKNRTRLTKAQKRKFFWTCSIGPAHTDHRETLLMSISIVRLICSPFCHSSQRLISEGPAPAVDVVVQSNPGLGSELVFLCFILKVDHVIITFNDSQVGVINSAVTLSVTPRFLLLDQIVLTST